MRISFRSRAILPLVLSIVMFAFQRYEAGTHVRSWSCSLILIEVRICTMGGIPSHEILDPPPLLILVSDSFDRETVCLQIISQPLLKKIICENCSSAGGHIEICKLLLDAKAKVNTFDNMLITPLHHAAKGQNLEKKIYHYFCNIRTMQGQREHYFSAQNKMESKKFF